MNLIDYKNAFLCKNGKDSESLGIKCFWQTKIEKILKKPQKFDLSYFNRKKDIAKNGSQNCLKYHRLFKSFETRFGHERILAWKFESFSEKIIKPPATSDISLAL